MAATQNHDTIVSVVECGARHTQEVGRAVVNSSILALQPLIESQYSVQGRGNTFVG